MKIHRISARGLKFMVSGSLLLIVFSLVPLESVLRATGNADLRLVLLASAAALLPHYVSAWQLYYLIKPQNISANVVKLLGINLTAHFYGCVLPVGAAASSFARWYKLSVINGQRAEAFAAIVLNRLLEFLTISGMGLWAWTLDPQSGRMGGLVGGLFASLFGLCVVAYGLSLSTRLLAWFQGVVDKLGHLQPSIAARVGKITLAFSAYPRLTVLQHSRLLALSMLRNLVGVLAFFLLCRAVGIQVSLLTLVWVKSATAILTFAPVSMLGLGIREISLLYLLRPYYIPEASAVALGFLTLATNLGVAAIGGTIEMHALIARWFSTRHRSIP